eukprot:gnl/TRDRNA2_/TRDRNA2_131969_c0_seq4.p1 gnl/TRDRNA2_/TRDRNA2_131969_c0~~gnl/TRDRNA2_/TRDRNA2_131969_c0_seq4.p1  ORF type:complete len:413 (-),score=130.98 gnl/TRDRNA2_/TRDRNA2_131969_c0_seq4:361-1479(-)
MPATKRPAASDASGAKKRGKSEVAMKLATVNEAIQSASLPKVVKAMLVEVAEGSLGVFKEERHACQEEVVAMIGETLASIQAGLQKEIDEKQKMVDGADQLKASRQTALTEAEKAQAAATTDLAAKKEAVEASNAASKAAKAALSSAESAQAEGIKACADAVGKKDALEACFKDSFTPLKEGTVTVKSDTKLHKKLLASLLAVCKKFEFEAEQVKVLPTILKKDPSERTSFESAAVTDLHEILSSSIKKYDETVQGAETTKATNEAAVKAATEANDAATAKLLQDQDHLKEAKAALKAADAASQAAKSAVSSFSSDFLQMQLQVAASKDDLDAFKTGPLGAFGDLKEWTAPPPPPPVVEEEKPAAPELPVEP